MVRNERKDIPACPRPGSTTYKPRTTMRETQEAARGLGTTKPTACAVRW